MLFAQKWKFFAWLVLVTIALTEATITIVETGERIISHPSQHIGARFRMGFEYMARLQYFPENLELCPEENPSPIRHNFTVTVPSDGLPVALLASKGKCTDFAKARFAAFDVLPSSVVRYLIIFDETDHHHPHGVLDEESIEESLLRNLESNDVDIKVLFVSHKNGMELLHAAASPDVESIGGPRILLDGRSATPLAKNVVFWMGLSLMLSACLCSFLLSYQVNRLNEDVETGDRAPRAPRRRLTVEEVETLIPEIEYSGTNTNHSLMSLMASASEAKEGHGDTLTCTLSDSEQQASTSPYVLLPHQDDCSICLDDYVQGDKIRSLPCGHGFHSACITKWLTERSSTCPLCKAILERVEVSDDESSFSSAAGDIVEVQEGGPDEEDGNTSSAVYDAYQSVVNSLAQARRRGGRWWSRRQRRRLAEQHANDEASSDEAISLSQQPLLDEAPEQPLIDESSDQPLIETIEES